jgi:2-amino-4-hydroxy-6-hydroxymethyldihydropteridine diphosphokinase
MPERAFIGIGSNLDSPVRRVRQGINALRSLGVVAAVSSLYVTSPWGITEQPDFINAVVAIDTELSPRELLDALKRLEQELGRQESERWGPRRIDFDILLYGEVEFDEGDLVIPHRRIYQRAFVLVPLAELLPKYEPARDELPDEERNGVRILGDQQAE